MSIMQTIRLSEVPSYLKEGEFYKSLDCSVDEEIQVPLGALKCNSEFNNETEFEHYLTSSSYWGVAELPYEVVDNALTKKVVNNDEFDHVYPILPVLRKLQNTAPKDQFKTAVELGSLSMVKYLVSKGHKITDRCGILASKAGQPEILKYLHERGAKMHKITCRMAYMSGNQAVLEYLRNLGVLETLRGAYILMLGSFYPDADAVFVPDLTTLMYALEQGCVMNERLCSTAAELGLLEVIQYAHEHGCVWDPATCTQAAKKGHLHTLQYAFTHGCVPNTQALCQAAEHNQLACMIYLHEVMHCPWSEEVFIYAGGYNALACLQYAHTHGCPVNVGAHRFAKQKGYLEVAKYLEECGIDSDIVKSEPFRYPE